jgi:hypothetical protein
MDWSYVAIWIGLPVLAGYIAHSKGRSWITAAFLTLLVPPIGIVIAFLQSPHPSAGQPTNTKAKILIGLSPLWVAVIVLIAGSYIYPSPEYWTVAPWIIVVAIPACAVPLALLELTARLKRAERK